MGVSVVRTEPKEIAERNEKKSSSTTITLSSSSSSSANSVTVKQTNSSLNSNPDKETRKDTKDREEREPRGRDRERERERESAEKVITIKEKGSSKDSKRDKDDSDGRKRDRGEKTRERERDRDRKYLSYDSPPYSNDRSNMDGVTSPVYSPVSPMYVHEPNDRYYPDAYDDKERDRDLSSISNSSKGSNNRRSQESPDERDIKRRRVEGSKVSVKCQCCYFEFFFLAF